MEYKVHSRQFLIGAKPLEAGGFVSGRLDCGLWLSRHEGLRAAEIRNADGELIVLLGECHSTDGVAPETVLEASSGLGAEALAELCFGFAGRWALVWKDMVIADACGLLPLFYGGGTVSSSLAMMKEYAGFGEQDPGFVEIEAGRMPDWVIAPSTRLKGVRKALPTQYLRLGKTVGAVHLERLDPARFKGLAKEEIYDRFTPEEISGKIVELLTPEGCKAEIKIVYQTLDGLIEATGVEPCELCTYCWNGKE